MSNVQGKKGVVSKRTRAWSDANKQGTKARMYLDNIPKGLKLRYGAGPHNRVLAVRKTVYPIPDVLVTKLKTSWTQDFTTGALGAFASGLWYGNSCNDPSAAAGSYQPRFFDELMSLFNNYTVYGVGVKISIINSPSSASRLIVYPSASGTASITDAYQNAGEINGNMRFDFAMAGAVQGNVNGPKVQKRYYDVASYFGRDQESIMDEASFSGTSTTDPSTLFYLHWGVDQYSNSAQVTVTAEIVVTQYVALRGVKIPSTST